MTDETTALEVSPEEADAAVAEETTVKLLKSQINGISFELASHLKEIRDKGYYVVLGFNTLNEWFSSPDIAITPAWAYHAIAMYETYIVELGKTPEELKDIDYSKLHSILPVIKKHPEKVDEWIAKANTLRRIDLQSEIKTQKISDRVEKIESLREIPVVSGVIHGSPVEEVAKLADNSVDVVITAPSPSVLPVVLQELFSEFRRVVKPNGSVFIFADFHNLIHITTAMGVNDYHLIRDIVLTYSNAKKNTGLQTLLPYHELVLWASRGEDVTYNMVDVERDIWAMPTIEDPEHPMEKPPEPILSLLKMASDEGQTILDPFAGSGNIVMAAKTLNRNVIAIEEDELWYKLILEKMHSI